MVRGENGLILEQERRGDAVPVHCRNSGCFGRQGLVVTTQRQHDSRLSSERCFTVGNVYIFSSIRGFRMQWSSCGRYAAPSWVLILRQRID